MRVSDDIPLGCSRRELGAMLALLLAPAAASAQDTDPWKAEALLSPEALAKELKGQRRPLIVSVAFPVLYRQRRIPSAVFGGPGGQPEGIALLRKETAQTSKTSPIVLYCGCCPMVKCPNIRPAYRALLDWGYTNVRVLSIPTNFHQDWVAKGYPTES